MISSNTRTTRSRFSSPAQQNHNRNRSQEGEREKDKDRERNGGGGGGMLEPSARGATNQGARSFMQRWLEPSPQSRTSFEEAGLLRYGVFESMAPLGQLPRTQGVKKLILKQSGSNANGSAKSAKTKEVAPEQKTLAAPAKVAQAEEQPQPPQQRQQPQEPQPPPSPALREPSPLPPSSPTVARQPRKSLPTKPPEPEDGGDEDYNPSRSMRRRNPPRVSLPKRGRPSQNERRSSVAGSLFSPVKRDESPTARPPTAYSESRGREFVDRIVNEAVEEAVRCCRYPTGYALRKFYDENQDEPGFVANVEKIFNQTADAGTMEEFSRQIKRMKRLGKKSGDALKLFSVSPEDEFLPKSGPYGKMLHRHTAATALTVTAPRNEKRSEPETPAAKKIKITHRSSNIETPRKMTSVAAGDGIVKTPGSRRRQRRDSNMTDSPLSSPMTSPPTSDDEESVVEIEQADATGDVSIAYRKMQQDLERLESRAASGASSSKAQPISTRGKSVASNSNNNNNRASGSISPSHPLGNPLGNPLGHTPATHARNRSSVPDDDASMPGRLAASALANSKTISVKNPGKNQAKNSAKSHTPDDKDIFLSKRKEEAQKITNSYNAAESWIRDEESRASTPATGTRKTRQSGLPSLNTRTTRSAHKRANDEELVESPAAFSFQGDGGSSATASRAVTPTNLRPVKKQKTGLRIKFSPVKKKGGTAAGLPRGEAQLPTRDQSADNDEFCSACGNTGDVVCCDGCPRSFHFECIDMVRSEDLPDEWFCNVCLGRWYPSRLPVHKGVFGAALNALDRVNPQAFSLPKKLQTLFDGVKAGVDGEYEEVLPPTKPAKKKNGYEEIADLHKQREDGEAVLCHDCQKPSNDVRAIIPCSVCPLHWHLDCLDPPMAHPPHLKTWRCPVHLDELLQGVPALAPAHRYRKVKGAPAISPALSRGLKNNGHIELDWAEETDDDEVEEPNRSGWMDPNSFGRVYKLPVKSVILDFIEQMRMQGAGYGSRSAETKYVTPMGPPRLEDPHQPLSGSAFNRNADEMQVALGLVSLKKQPADGIENLVTALLDSADDNMLSLMAKGNVQNYSRRKLEATDKASLRAMLAQVDALGSTIRGLLGGDAEVPVPSAITPRGTETPEPVLPEHKEANGKMDQDGPVTEPTPPSTIDNIDGPIDFD